MLVRSPISQPAAPLAALPSLAGMPPAAQSSPAQLAPSLSEVQAPARRMVTRAATRQAASASAAAAVVVADPVKPASPAGEPSLDPPSAADIVPAREQRRCVEHVLLPVFMSMCSALPQMYLRSCRRPK